MMATYRVIHLGIHGGNVDDAHRLGPEAVGALQRLMADGRDAEARATLIDHGAYAHVADVEVPADRIAPLEDVYKASQSVDRPWWENAGVYPTAEAMRSTSVGDLIVDPQGQAHACMTVGFAHIGAPPPAIADLLARAPVKGDASEPGGPGPQA